MLAKRFARAQMGSFDNFFFSKTAFCVPYTLAGKFFGPARKSYPRNLASQATKPDGGNYDKLQAKWRVLSRLYQHLVAIERKCWEKLMCLNRISIFKETKNNIPRRRCGNEYRGVRRISINRSLLYDKQSCDLCYRLILSTHRVVRVIAQTSFIWSCLFKSSSLACLSCNSLALSSSSRSCS